MKKYVIALSLSLLLLSCGSTEVKPSPEANTPKPSPVETPTEAPITESTEEKMSATMEEIFKKWVASTCSFITTEEGQTLYGIFYVDSKKVRYTMNSTIQGKKVTNDVIVKDGYSYSWSSMQAGQGFKMKDDFEDTNEENEDEMESEERNKKIDFSCKSGVPSGIFDLPSNIKFKEFSIPQLPQGMGME